MTLALALLAVVSFLAAAFFAGCETALIASSRVRLSHMAGPSRRSARIVMDFLARPERFLSAVLIGTNLGVVACTTSFTALLERKIGASSSTLATVILVPLLLVFQELIPKGLALAYAERVSLLAAYPLRAFALAAAPLIDAASRLTSLLLRVMGVERRSEARGMSTEEVLFHLKESEQAGLITAETMALARRAVALRELKAADTMLPLERIVMAEEGRSLEDYRKLFARERFSRIPLYRGSRNQVVGVLAIRALLVALGGGRLELEEPYLVPGEASLMELLPVMKNRGCHMAFVCGKAGVEGMVTMEDILERLVGAIADEFH